VAEPTTLTGYGGVGEIGGNAFLLDDGRTRLLLDAGRRFGAATVEYQLPESYVRRPGFGDYFDPFLKARSFSAARDLMALDLVPRLPSLYRTDLGGLASDRAPVDAICITHAHQDHFGLLGLVRPDVPVLASKETVATFANLQETSARGWETDLLDLQLRAGVGYTKGRGKEPPKLTTRVLYGDGEAGPARTFQLGRHEVGDWTVEQAPVDHSIQGAVGFILTRKDGFKVVYTGDFRAHGRRPELTARFLKQAEDPDVLLVEGTRVRRASDDRHDAAHGAAPGARTDSEAAVEQELDAILARHEAEHGAGFVGIGYPMRDVDRLLSIWLVARRLGRRLVLQPKQAHLLRSLREAGREDLPDPRTDRNLAIFVKSQVRGTVMRRGAPLLRGNKLTLALEALEATPAQWLGLVSSELDKWERTLLGGSEDGDVPIQLGDNAVTPLDVAGAPRDYLFTLSYWNMTDLFDVFPEREKARGLYVHSQTQPFNDDLELVMFKLKRWCDAFGLVGPVHTHVSGHADEGTLQGVLEALKPKVLVPVHSEAPGMTADWYSHRIGRKALVPQVGQPLQVG